MDIKSFISAISQIVEEKSIPRETVKEITEQAMAAAYKKDYGKRGQKILAELNFETGETKFWQEKLVVDQSMILSDQELAEKKEGKDQAKEEEKKFRFNPEKHILLEEAKKENKKIKSGEVLSIPLEVKEGFGRIAAQTAKQVILQKIREAERDVIFKEYKDKEEEIISGIVQRIEGKNVFLDIGKTLGILTKEEQVPREFYRPGQRLKTYILKVEDNPKGPVIFLSRAYPKIISKLFELEVPEISQGQVQIKSIAREAGSRSKIAVSSQTEGVDPIGSAVGQRGARVTAVISELGGEKIDIIEYSEDPEKYIANSLSPAKIQEVKILPKNKALVTVPEDQLSLAIGKNGQNVRLAAKLTGWKIDVKGSAEVEKEKKPKNRSASSADALKKRKKKKENSQEDNKK